MNVLEKKELNNALVAFMCTWGLQLILGITVRNPLTLVFFFLFLLIGKKVRTNRKKKDLLPVFVVAEILSVAATYLFGRRAVAGFDSGLFKAAGIVIILIGTFLSYFRVIQFVFKVGDPGGREGAEVKNSKEQSGASSKEKAIDVLWKSEISVFVIAAVLCFLCWFPYFLYEYPGIMTADSIVQYEQVVGINPLSNHHPVAHTLIIGFFYNIGMRLTGNVNGAMSVYTLAQMVFLALCCARVVLQVKRLTDKKIAAVLSLVFFALVPFNSVFAVTVWKDIPFAGIVMLLGSRLCEMAFRGESKTPDFVLFTILSVFMSVFRSNGWYAFLICVPFFIYGFRKYLLKAIASVVIAIIITLIIKGPVMNAAGITQPDFTESLALPIQQIARVLVEDVRVEDKDIELIDAVIDRTYIHELYVPDFADNIKELVRAGHPEVIENNKMKYLGLWMRLGMSHPIYYVKAWFDLEGGYVYPDVSYDVGNIDGIMPNDYGLIPTPRIGGKVVVKGKEILIKLGSFVPLYGMLWCAGAYTWLVGAALILMIKRKKTLDGKLTAFLILQAALVLTLLIAAPVVDFRYEYAVVMLMPLTASICAMIMKKRI